MLRERKGIARHAPPGFRLTRQATAILLAWVAVAISADPLHGSVEQIRRGQAVFRENCAVCHGADASGENPEHWAGGFKDDGGYWAPALDGTAHAWHHSPASLFDTIKNGSPAADSSMRGWDGKISDADICAVIAYLLSLWPEAKRRAYWERFGEDRTCALAPTVE